MDLLVGYPCFDHAWLASQGVHTHTKIQIALPPVTHVVIDSACDTIEFDTKCSPSLRGTIAVVMG